MSRGSMSKQIAKSVSSGNKKRPKRKRKTKVKMTVEGYYTDDNGFWTIYKTKSGMTVMKKEKKNNDN